MVANRSALSIGYGSLKCNPASSIRSNLPNLYIKATSLLSTRQKVAYKRSNGNNIIREIVRELNQAQRIEIDGANGFARLKLYRYFTDLTPELTIDCQRNKGIQFNAGVPVDGVLRFPSEGVFRGPNRRSVYVDDFLVNYNFDTGPGSQTFKGSYLELTLILAMEEDVMDDSFRPNKEQHIYHRNVFLGSSYINSRVTNMMGLDNEV